MCIDISVLTFLFSSFPISPFFIFFSPASFSFHSAIISSIHPIIKRRTRKWQPSEWLNQWVVVDCYSYQPINQSPPCFVLPIFVEERRGNLFGLIDDIGPNLWTSEWVVRWVISGWVCDDTRVISYWFGVLDWSDWIWKVPRWLVIDTHVSVEEIYSVGDLNDGSIWLVGSDNDWFYNWWMEVRGYLRWCDDAHSIVKSSWGYWKRDAGRELYIWMDEWVSIGYATVSLWFCGVAGGTVSAYDRYDIT